MPNFFEPMAKGERPPLQTSVDAAAWASMDIEKSPPEIEKQHQIQPQPSEKMPVKANDFDGGAFPGSESQPKRLNFDIEERQHSADNVDGVRDREKIEERSTRR